MEVANVVTEGAMDLTVGRSGGEELGASVGGSKVVVVNGDVADTVAKNRCCGSEEKVEKLEEDLAKSEKTVKDYYITAEPTSV